MKIARRLLCFVVVAAVVGIVALSAAPAAQDEKGFKIDPNAKPNFGEVKLEAGFAPDPFKKELVAGGPAKVKVNGIEMYIDKVPDFRLFYKAGNAPLTIWVDSPEDTTLFINLPDDKWVAADDSENGKNLNPVVKLEKPTSGRYDIFVGTIKPKAAKAVMYITELK